MQLGKRSCVAVFILSLALLVDSYNVPGPTRSFTISRRQLVFGSASFASMQALVTTAPPSAQAGSFRPLEAVRILNQEASDNLKYDGELAPVNGAPNSPASLLEPIQKINDLLKEARAQVNADVADPSQWEDLRRNLSSPPLSKKEFKQVFNAFADNIYYVAGSERANAYLIGGATPTTQQTTQYLWRNEILGNVETAVLELDYLIKLRDKGETSREALVGEELDDLRGFLDEVCLYSTGLLG